MSNATTAVKGFLTYSQDGDKITETHYAVKPNGQVLFSAGHRVNVSTFGPKNPDDWGQSSSLPAGAEFIGNYQI